MYFAERYGVLRSDGTQLCH